MRRRHALTAALLACGGVAGRVRAAPALDVALLPYEPRAVAPPAGAGYLAADGAVRIVSGNRGFETVLRGFNALFERTHPGIRFALSFNRQGNTLNMAALTFGTTLFAPLGRDINREEFAAYRHINGSTPLEIEIAHGTLTATRMTAGLAVYINKKNPLRRLTMAQLERMFTTGAPGGDLTTWGQLGGAGPWAAAPIHLYGTPESSGYGYFMVNGKWHGRRYAPGYEAFDLAADIVKRVGEDPNGIGFAGQGFLTPETALVALADDAAGPFMEGDEAEVASSRYPLDRRVGLALRRLPGQPIDPVAAEYLRLVLSREGQAIVAAEGDGYVPLTAAQVASQRARLDAAR